MCACRYPARRTTRESRCEPLLGRAQIAKVRNVGGGSNQAGVFGEGLHQRAVLLGCVGAEDRIGELAIASVAARFHLELLDLAVEAAAAGLWMRREHVHSIRLQTRGEEGPYVPLAVP